MQRAGKLSRKKLCRWSSLSTSSACGRAAFICSPMARKAAKTSSRTTSGACSAKLSITGVWLTAKMPTISAILGLARERVQGADRDGLGNAHADAMRPQQIRIDAGEIERRHIVVED